MKQVNKNIVEQWIDKYTDDMIRYAVFRTNDLMTAQDLVNDTFEVVLNKFVSFKEQSTPKTWLFGILNNKIKDYFKYRKKVESSLDINFTPEYFDTKGKWIKEKEPIEWDESLTKNEDFLHFLALCLEELPEKWRECILMKYFNDMKGDEICQELAISSTNLWQIVHRAKMKLRNCLNQNWFKDEV